MSFGEAAYIYTMISPQDAVEIEASLPVMMTPVPRDGFGFCFEVYAATHPAFWMGLRKLYDAHVPVTGILDASQEVGAGQARTLAGFFADYPQAKADIAVGSMPGHNIVHLKGLFNNVPLDPAAPYTIPQKQNWQAALLAGCSVAWTGSWNVSTRASRQANNVDIVLSRARCLAFYQTIEENRTHLLTMGGTVDTLLAGYHDGDTLARVTER